MIEGSRSRRTVDVAILGGGIIGLTCAEEIRRRGATVAVVDPRPAGEASWAAGGMLAADYEFNAPSPLAGFARHSRSRWPALAERLGVPFTQGGTLCPAQGGEELERLWSRWSWNRSQGTRINRLDAREALEREPALPPAIGGALLFPDEPAIDNRAVLGALAGELSGDLVVAAGSVWMEGGRVAGVVLPGSRRLAARRVVDAAGVWASKVAEGVPPLTAIKGQMLSFRVDRPLSGVVRWEGGYAVPRGTDRVVVGSSLEPTPDCDKRVTPEECESLSRAFRTWLPGHSSARPLSAWAGLRPAAADELPLIGEVRSGLLLAGGHYRNGILLAPATAEAIADLAEGKRPQLDLAAFRPDRPSLSAGAAWIRVNGEPRALVPGATVGSLLEALVLRRPGVAVALNDEVVRRGEWDRTPLRGDDRVEIIHAVGGG